MDIPIKIGEKLDIVIKNKVSKGEGMPVSQVMESCGSNEFIVAMPICKGELIPLHIGEEIKLLYYRRNGIYSFWAKVVDRRKGKLPWMKIRALSEPQKTQRRDYYRLEMVFRVKVHYNPKSETQQSENEQLVSMKCFTLDISAGGLRLASNIELQKDDLIVCEIALPDKTFSVNGKVIRSIAVYNLEYQFEIGVQFIGLDEKTRLWLINFIFEEERKLIRKGLI